MPFLQAETDCKCALLSPRAAAAAATAAEVPTHACRARPRARNAFFEAKRVENEAELMKDVPNWEAGASVYKTRDYMAPMTVFAGVDR